MRKILFFLTVVFLLLPIISIAQESDELQAESTEDSMPKADEVKESAGLEESIETAVEEATEEMQLFQRIGIAVAIILCGIFLIWGIWRLFKHFNYKLEHASGKGKIKPLTIKKIQLLTAKQFIGIIEFFLRILKYIVTFIMLFLTIPIIFGLFPATKHVASLIFGYILTPLTSMAINTVNFFPSLITIIIVIIITRYVIKALKVLANRIAKGKMVIPGFYAEWALPTMMILKVLLWAFALVIIYPHLPGSDSGVFQGVSVFIGVLFSLGSTSAIGNLVAGLVITYMRPFKIGDRVKINEVTGFVAGKNLMVVRLKTHKNEYVTFPNTMILSSNIINYNTSTEKDDVGLILYSDITFGYSTPWQTIYDILIKAALATRYVQKTPKPFVHQTKLDDFYTCYQINCYTKEVNKIPSIYTMLHENIQNGFREAGLDMTASHYRVISSVQEEGSQAEGSQAEKNILKPKKTRAVRKKII